jgi:hypothetical protein
MVNLDDTRRCPVEPECESCGRLDELAVVTEDTPVGVICMTGLRRLRADRRSAGP